MTQTILVSFGLVAVSEMGDKTQLLAFALATRFKKPWPILLGILCATVLNHALAAFGGSWVSNHVPANVLRWILGGLFIGFGVWILVPDKDNDRQSQNRFGAFLTTLVTFFLAEMGDKTQLATVALAARFQSIFFVTVGTTLGMLFADGLAVFAGEKVGERFPMIWVRRGASMLFILFGLFILLQKH
jgi:putative Ca2+/H+ antiporter (TMEM165/GDT1 family)